MLFIRVVGLSKYSIKKKKKKKKKKKTTHSLWQVVYFSTPISALFLFFFFFTSCQRFPLHCSPIQKERYLRLPVLPLPVMRSNQTAWSSPNPGAKASNYRLLLTNSRHMLW
eukprot:TRINITY_DN2001_c0_g1_i3.p2 TRINITY_DN2001_c0_g1~~TRINITY_DN2001_c0_g1_i3.p2  ORF type:complete len:111 (+),score=3.66 TRINITY_DN2001_c0_g1_i3:229-561(+)